VENLKNIVPDPSWRGFYKVGGVCAMLYVALALFAPFFLYVNHTALSRMATGSEILDLIRSNGTVWWTNLQTLVLGSSFFAILAFLALFIALKHVDKVNALIGSTIAIVIHILFIAYYPVMLALGFLSKAHGTAESTQRASFETAAEALLAINNAFNPLYEAVFATSIFFLSLAMLKGVFDKKLALLGMVTAASAFIALMLWPLIGIGYFWWWLLFTVWFFLIGIKLYRLGKA